jgi:hypothetical protein
MCLKLPFAVPKFCPLCGKGRRSLLLNTESGSITCFECRSEPIVVARGYDVLDLSPEDFQLLEEMRIKP